MVSQKNTITINGKLYDINSGALLSVDNSNNSDNNHKAIEKVQQITKPKNIDGINSSTKTITVNKKIQPTEQNNKDILDHKKIINSFQRSKNLSNRRLSRTNTLARNFVKKPDKPIVKSKPEELYPQKIELHNTIDKQRLMRAKDIQQDNKVSKFGHISFPNVQKTIVNIDVVPEPKQTNSNYDISDIPPAPIVNSPTLNTSKGSELFENAILTSTSHKEEFKNDNNKKKKITAITSTIIVAVLISGLYLYQSIPNISLKTASSKIGFNATIPKYKPSGFGLEDSIKYQAGKVTLNFRSNSDDRNFTIEQTKSEYDSASLLSSFLIANKKEYQTQVSNGRTVYIYNGTDATWVDSGIWYKLIDNANLSNEQILNIVSSL